MFLEKHYGMRISVLVQPNPDVFQAQSLAGQEHEQLTGFEAPMDDRMQGTFPARGNTAC